MARLSFVGVGIMGGGMAKRLLDAGHELTIWNRSDSDIVAGLLAAGARRAETVEGALQSEVVFSMLANDEAALERFSVEALAGAASGTIHVNMATVSLATADLLESRHAEAGVGYIAAPVMGRPEVAAAGMLNIVTGGPAEVVEKVRPHLELMGKKVWTLGDRPRAANLVKIAVNYNLIHAIQALAESVTLVEKGGVAGQDFVDLLTDAAFTGSAYTGYGRIIAARDYVPFFRVELGMKDLSLAEAAAADRGVVMPTAPVLHDMFAQTLADPELAPLDWSAIAEITRRLSGDEQTAS